MPHYHIFLSYINKDAEIMWRVYQNLRHEGLTVWIDQTNLDPGTLAWDRAIEEAIVSADCMVVLLSPAARKSEWVREELHYAKTLGKRIYPLLVAGEAHDAIPFGFSTAQYMDVRGERYDAAVPRLIEIICKQSGVESRSAREARLQREEESRKERDRQMHQMQEVRQQVQALGVQARMVEERISQILQEEAQLKAQLDWLALQRGKLQEDYRLVCRQEQHAKEYLLNLTAALNLSDPEALQQTHEAPAVSSVLDDQEWTRELPRLDVDDEISTAGRWTIEGLNDDDNDDDEDQSDMPRLNGNGGYPQLPPPQDRNRNRRRR